MTIIDLSTELAHGMVRHPAPHLPEVEVVPVANHDEHKRSVMRVSFGTHVATHLDAPLHAIKGGTSIDKIPLEFFCGPAAMIRISGVSRANPIDKEHLAPFEEVMSTHSRVVIETGWARETWGGKSYFTEGPYLTRAAARYVDKFPIKLIGSDFPNIDSVEETYPGFAAPNHNILLKTERVLLENLLNLHMIDKDVFDLIALPLKLTGGDGCPCRAVARL